MDELPEEYVGLVRAGRSRFGWLALGLIGVVALMAVMQIVLSGVAEAVAHAAGRGTTSLLGDVSHGDVTPLGLLYLDLGLATGLVAVAVVARYVHGCWPRFLLSVTGRLRWRWFAVCLGWAAVVIAVVAMVGALLPDTSGGVAVAKSVATSSDTWWFLLVIVLGTPLQALAEEVIFRGYLMNVTAAVFRSTWVVVLLPALVFALLHGTQGVPAFLDRLAFGLVAGYLALRTQGLEAGFAMHLLNNALLFAWAALSGQMDHAFDDTGGTWTMLVGTAVQSVLYVVLIRRASRSGVGLGPGQAV